MLSMLSAKRQQKSNSVLALCLSTLSLQNQRLSQLDQVFRLL